ncbi:MAG: serine/threonine-protein kinase [Pyrinomonadaceae bacterium]
MKKCPICSKQYEDTITLCPSDGTVLKKSEDALIGQILSGKYRIEEKIDEGGMGAVYRATHILMEKTLAIKVLHPALAADDTIVARFTREAKAASRISHPHALTVTDFGESENGVVFLVMEYIRGRTLKEIIRAEGPFPLARVVEIIRQVCGALTAAHAEGVVHRDLKSDNIMLEESGGGDWAKVLDFGIAKIQEPVGSQDPGLTAPNLIIGTPQYMSPEQCSQASEIDSRSDIYSLGVILFEMLVGHVPFTGDSPTAIMMQHLQDAPPSVLDERKDLPVSVGRVVARALAKKPQERYQSASELSEDFALAAADEAPAVATTMSNESRPETDRIVVPTGANAAARVTENEDHDEATVVSGRVPTGLRAPEREAMPVFVEPPPPSSGFSPMRVVLPAIAAIAVIFAIIYALESRKATTDERPPLTSDPNGLPVQSVTPPNGRAETNIVPSSGVPAATPIVAGATTAGGVSATTGANQNVNLDATPTPARGAEDRNKNQNTDDAPEEDATPEATPTPSNRNSNKRNAPPQPVNSNDDDDAPPPPAPSKKNPPAPANTPPQPKLGEDSAPPFKP